eukprot:10373327-Ditylum_brightwellii.AAC.1
MVMDEFEVLKVRVDNFCRFHLCVHWHCFERRRKAFIVCDCVAELHNKRAEVAKLVLRVLKMESTERTVFFKEQLWFLDILKSIKSGKVRKRRFTVLLGDTNHFLCQHTFCNMFGIHQTRWYTLRRHLDSEESGLIAHHLAHNTFRTGY